LAHCKLNDNYDAVLLVLTVTFCLHCCCRTLMTLGTNRFPTRRNLVDVCWSLPTCLSFQVNSVTVMEPDVMLKGWKVYSDGSALKLLSVTILQRK